MFFVMGNRDNLVELFPKHGRWVEIGVYRGDFSQKIFDIAKPSELYLIDNWKFEVADHNPFVDVAENFSGFAGKVHWQHFGDDPNATQEQNYQYVKARFANVANVKIIRANSFEGISRLPDHHFDVMYIDANHQYDYVLRDMMEAKKKLKNGGIILMNDFYEGPGGAEQNLGVMAAVNTFVKRYSFHYVAMSYSSFADVALTDDPTSPLVRQVLDNLKNSNLNFIGLSDSFVQNIRYKLYKKADGTLRYVAFV